MFCDSTAVTTAAAAGDEAAAVLHGVVAGLAATTVGTGIFGATPSGPAFAGAVRRLAADGAAAGATARDRTSAVAHRLRVVVGLATDLEVATVAAARGTAVVV